jgi:cobalt-zinc-cadmium efflux system membrane fusion protein
MKFNWKMAMAVVLIAAGATAMTLSEKTRAHVIGVWKQISHATSHGSEEARSDRSWTEKPQPQGTWDRTLELEDNQIKAIGLETVRVQKQEEPTRLPLVGTTDYDPATLTRVRTMFDSRVENVLVDLGATVKKGDALIELFSTDLAAAKSDYEMAVSQYDRDKKVYDYKKPLAESNTLPRKELIEIENDLAQSSLKMKLAKDKLLVYGLTEQEIDNAKNEDGKEKARMVLRAQAEGVVVKRDAVKGNYYESKDEMMLIAPLDHLWVRGNVSELDAEKIEVGQKLEIIFPFSDQTIDAQVDYIDKAIDPDTRSAKFRTTIKNPNGRFKAGMFVKVVALISPREGYTVIPRSAMVSVDGSDYVFIKRPGKANQFERRPILAATERNDIVIVAAPTSANRELREREEVVTTGSLILEQMYEDRLMTEGGLLVSDTAQKKLDRFERTNVTVSTSH